MTADIRLVIIDNEGCFIPAKGKAIPITPIKRLQTYLSQHNEVRFTFCTGRSMPYMEAMVQLAGLTESALPVICEGGAILYLPSQDRYEPLASPINIELLLKKLPPNSYRFEPGKMVCVTLYPEKPYTVSSLYNYISSPAEAHEYSITTSAAAIDITPLGVNKRSGVEHLAYMTGAQLSQILCIGDATNDLPMLTLVGKSACPSNASQDVKDVVSYVSPYPYTEGVLDILQHFFGL